MTARLRGLGEPTRTYPEALADQLARCRPGDRKLAFLNRLYIEMSPADQLRVRSEIYQIQRAKRCEMLATAGKVRP